jgi:hypothetical protein
MFLDKSTALLREVKRKLINYAQNEKLTVAADKLKVIY